MKVDSITTKICKNKYLKRGLELSANNGALFVAGAQLALATVVRPISIELTPKTDKENKKLACAKSFASALTNYLLVFGISLPIAKSIRKIDRNPEKYLSNNSIERMKEAGKPLLQSKSYQFATQMFKLGVSTLTAAPKAIITCALIPPIMSGIKRLNNKNKKKEGLQQPVLSDEKKELKKSYLSIGEKMQISSKQKNPVSFNGIKGINIAKKIGKIIDTPFMQNCSEKYKDSNFQMHTMALADTITTLTLMKKVNSNKKIDEDRKKVLNYNAGLATGFGIFCGYSVDKLLDKPTEKFIKKFSQVNINDPKLSKYVEGIKIAKPTLIYGGIYYALIPFVSTFLAERVNRGADRLKSKTKSKA